MRRRCAVAAAAVLLAASLVAGCNGNSDSDKKPKDSDSGAPPSSLPSIFINELMASNTASFPDEVGSFEDWIELWKGLPADSDVDEVVRNFFVRQPLLWVPPGPGASEPAR